MKGEFNQVLEKLKDLPNGWDFGYGIGTLQNVADKVTDIYNNIVELNIQFELIPSTDGGISLIILKENGDDFINLSINIDLTIDLTHEKGKGFQYEILDEKENVDYPYIISKIKYI